MADQLDPEFRDFVSRLYGAAPNLGKQAAELVAGWLEPLLERLESGAIPKEPKVFNDPIWGSILMQPAEVLLLDTPLLQRLRGIRQLGMAHLVFPGSGYGRLEHVCGVVEAAARIVMALDKSAAEPRGADPVPARRPEDLEAIRIAALLHDIGHGPFSHATEPLLEDHYNDEIEAAKAEIFLEYDDVQKIAPSELVAILMIVSPTMLRVLTHARFPVAGRVKLPGQIIATVLGSAKYFSVPYLAGVVSGPIDADKLDYMARDSHHAGLTVGLETTRLLSQLQVVTVTPDNAPNREIRERAESHDKQRYYDLGITRAGVGAYELMIVGRAILFDRLYYHQKIRVAEAMVRRLISLSEKDKGGPYELAQLLPIFSDETHLCVLGGMVNENSFPTPSAKTRDLAAAIRNRNLYHRAFAFAGRYIAGLDALEEEQAELTRSLIGRDIIKIASEPERARKLEIAICEMARLVAENLGGKYAVAKKISEHEIIVDLPPPGRVTVRGQDILVQAGGGQVEIPNVFFDPEKWSRAYQAQKHCGFVFCPHQMIPAVNLAAKIVFAKELRVVFDESAERLSKTYRLHSSNVFDQIVEKNLCDLATIERLKSKQTQFVKIVPEDIHVPNSWSSYKANLRKQLADKIMEVHPPGFSHREREAILGLFDGLSSFYEIAYEGGSLKNAKIGEEEKIQSALRDHLRSRKYIVDEASRVGGGKIDLLFEKLITIENKIHPQQTNNPLNVGKKYAWQARRYTIPVATDIFATVVGYKPLNELGIKKGPDQISVRLLEDDTSVEIRLAVPVDYSNPSSAIAPKKKAPKKKT